jgi:hypothetical protein
MYCGECICCKTEGGKFCRRQLVPIGCGIVNVKVQRNNINIFVLDTVIGLVGKVERRPRYIWVTQKMIKYERRKCKSVKNID